MRIIFVPQYPVPNRYPEWWFWKFPEEFRKAGFEVITLGEDYANMMEHRRGGLSLFSPINMSVEFETEQIREYMSLDLRYDDILFLADISFPGFFCNTLFHKKPPKCFAFCHATSINKRDYFSDMKIFKFPIESMHASMFDTIFIGSEYHKNKLGWKNTVVTYLPNPDHIKTFPHGEKIYDIVSASRPCFQKVNESLEKRVEKYFNTKIVRKETYTQEEYYRFLGQSRILLITSYEDTFGYQIVDAINNGCIPIARNSFSYPELLPKDYLYSNDNELMGILKKALQGDLKIPKLKCEENTKDFFKNMIGEIHAISNI